MHINYLLAFLFLILSEYSFALDPLESHKDRLREAEQAEEGIDNKKQSPGIKVRLRKYLKGDASEQGPNQTPNQIPKKKFPIRLSGKSEASITFGGYYDSQKDRGGEISLIFGPLTKPLPLSIGLVMGKTSDYQYIEGEILGTMPHDPFGVTIGFGTRTYYEGRESAPQITMSFFSAIPIFPFFRMVMHQDENQYSAGLMLKLGLTTGKMRM